MFDNNKNHDEFHEETNTQNEQEIGHYEYHKEAPKQPQDHKKKKCLLQNAPELQQQLH